MKKCKRRIGRFASYTLIPLYLISLLPSPSFAQGKHKRNFEPDTAATDDYYSKGQTLLYENYIYKDNIRTAIIQVDGYQISYPIIKLGDADRFAFGFDDLNGDFTNYSYTFIHCNADWQPSNLLPSDYITGFRETPISTYKYSYNTTRNYTHYSCTFPDESTHITKSGNYILLVFQDFDKENIVLTKRFMIYEDKVRIDAHIRRGTLVDQRETSHEIDFTINHRDFEMMNPFGDLKVTLMQNQRWDNAITSLKPLFVKDDDLIYDYQEENVFLAGNEYRTFDTRSIRYMSEKIRNIAVVDSVPTVFLFTEEKRSALQFFNLRDMNGNYYVNIQEGNESDVEADYVNVHFALKTDEPVTDGNIYIFGGLSDWRFRPDCKMVYNSKKGIYEATILLKQGLYNYEYMFRKDKQNAGDVSLIEGSHYQTEQSYVILAYYRDVFLQYDRLLSARTFNSLTNY